MSRGSRPGTRFGSARRAGRRHQRPEAETWRARNPPAAEGGGRGGAPATKTRPRLRLRRRLQISPPGALPLCADVYTRPRKPWRVPVRRYRNARPAGRATRGPAARSGSLPFWCVASPPSRISRGPPTQTRSSRVLHPRSTAKPPFRPLLGAHARLTHPLPGRSVLRGPERGLQIVYNRNI